MKIKLSVQILCLMMTLCVAVSSRAQAPLWHLDVNNATEAWKITTGSKALVVLVDSRVEYNTYLKDKAYRQKKDLTHQVYNKSEFINAYNRGFFEKSILRFNNTFFNTAEHAYGHYNHGTNMLSVVLVSKQNIPYEENPRSQIAVSGVAPDAQFIDFSFGVDFGFCQQHPGIFEKLEDVKDKVDVIKQKSKKSSSKKKKADTTRERALARVFTINLSAEEKFLRDQQTYELFYKDWLKGINIGKDLLLIAAAGNNGLNLDIECIAVKYQPACLKSSGDDLIIKVGSLAPYIQGANPQISAFSNYGKEYVDILVPGESIATLTAAGFSAFVQGTSPATAILSGVAALLASCRPETTALEIKHALLNNADKYSHLKAYVKEGCVLNIWKTVKAFCPYDDGNDPYVIKSPTGQRSDL